MYKRQPWGAVALLAWWRDGNQALVRIVWRLGLALAVGLAFLVVVYPWMWPDPPARLAALFTQAQQWSRENQFTAFYLGRSYLHTELPWHFGIVMVAITMPLATFVHVVGTCLTPSPKDALWRSAAIHAGFWMLMMLLPTTPRYDNERQLLPIFPWLCVLAAYTFSNLTERLGRWLPVARTQLAGAALLSGILGAALFGALPFPLGFYSGIVGGRPGATALGFEAASGMEVLNADTLAAVQEIQRKGGTVLGMVNVVGSSIARQCGAGIYLHAGPEVAVVSTKTFTNTLAAFALLALHLGRMRDVSPAAGKRIIQALEALPDQVQGLIDRAAEFAEVATRYAQFDRAYFIGRCEGFGLAREGALKLKEISYIHAEAYPASELKHGPLALIDPRTPTIALVPDDDLLAKNLSSIAEIKARKGPVLAIGQSEVLAADVDDYIRVPRSHPLLDPILMLIPLQFFAYHAALARGCDVDKPRNLAKSVTVE